MGATESKHHSRYRSNKHVSHRSNIQTVPRQYQNHKKESKLTSIMHPSLVQTPQFQAGEFLIEQRAFFFRTENHFQGR